MKKKSTQTSKTKSYFDSIYIDSGDDSDSSDHSSSSSSDDDDSSEHRSSPSSASSFETCPSPLMGFTENNSATFLSSGNPCLDFFFHVVPNSPSQTVMQRLQLSYQHDPLKTLKLVCNLRGVRGTGKSDKENFYTSALWLHENHPKTLACNLEIFAQFGYFKDLPEILYRLLEGPQIRKEKKEAWNSKKGTKKAWRGSQNGTGSNQSKNAGRREVEKKRRLRARVPREKRVADNKIKVNREREKAKYLRKLKEISMVERAEERYEKDENYRFLHDKISSVFAECLHADILSLNSNELKKISLAAKWCPSVDSSYDKATLLCKSIGKLMFPRESSTEFAALNEEQYVYTVRNKLRKEVLVPLHEALKLPEVYMSAKEWTSLAYERVASIAMKNYTNIFMNRDKTRFEEYLENVKVGKAKIAAQALLPHEIIGNLNGSSGEATVAELQWKRMVDDLLEKGKLTNCLAICDVSGSMNGTPMEVSVALGLLLSELCEDPWKGHVITFSADPQLHLIKPGDLKSKTEFIRNMQWNMNTDFQKVFDRILEIAVSANLPEDQMIKRLFVFSDMEFDQASSSSRRGSSPSSWETDYKVIERKFRKKGYKNVPEIVFWNLRDSSATPVTAKQNGVALVSGYSKNLLTIFLEGGEAMNPETIMEAAISGEMYQKLVVYD